MIIPANIEELASFVRREGKTVFFFTTEWCGDCRFIKPFCLRLKQKILILPLLRSIVTTIWKLPKSGMCMGFLA